MVEKLANGFDMTRFKTEVRVQNPWGYVVFSNVNYHI